MPNYSPVYSTQFIVYTSSTPNTLYDVPEGFTAVIRDIDAYIQGEIADLLVAIANGPGAPYCGIWYTTFLGIQGHDQWRGRVVVPGGGSIALDPFAEGLELSVYVGGYLLRNVAT